MVNECRSNRPSKINYVKSKNVLNINFYLSKAQSTILFSKARFKVVKTGRQFGKSYLGAVFVVTLALQKKNSTGWIVAPVFRQALMLLDKVRELCETNKIEFVYNKTEMMIYFPLTHSKVCAMSGDDPNKIRGQTLDYLVIDEAAFIGSDIYEEHLEPMIAIRKAPVMFISTPYGRNWFYDLYKYAESGEDPEYQAFHYTSADNPLMPKDFLEKVKSKVDPLKYKQEYLADWLDEGGLVFNHYITRPVIGHPDEKRCYLAGLDLGKHVDYTVMTIADINTYEICDEFRFNKYDWDEQADMIQEYSKRYKNCPIYMDSTGVGDSMVDRLKNRGLTIYPMVFSNTTKKQMIQNLVVMLQNEELAIPDNTVCIKEFERFEFTLLPSGAIKYAAPGKQHDDYVCSMALLAWGLEHTAKAIGGYLKDNQSVTKDSTLWKMVSFEWAQEEFNWAYQS